MASIRATKPRTRRVAAAALAFIAVPFTALADEILLSSRREERLKVELGF